MRDHRWRLGPLLFWWGGRAWSFHAFGMRVIWVRDIRRWPDLFSERVEHHRYWQVGPYRIRAWEVTSGG